jgi:hypothetical protein
MPHRAVQQHVMEAILKERLHQDRQWGHDLDDTQNTPWMWAAYVCCLATTWMNDPHRITVEDTNELYDCMIQAAATAAACCESILRQRQDGGTCWYEENKK